jgi:hypothetical protein
MSNAKVNSVTPAVSRETLEKLTASLTDQGLLIEAGFSGFRALCISEGAPEQQLHDLRIAFFAGAQHLFSSIMTVLDPEDEPTAQDLGRMNKIHEELQRFSEQFSQMLKAMQAGSA